MLFPSAKHERRVVPSQVNPPQPLAFFDIDERSEERRELPMQSTFKIWMF